MIKATCTIKGISPLSFSKVITMQKNEGELHDAFEKRAWRDRLHVNADGNVFIPPAALKGAMFECAKYLSEKIPGERNATWTKHFEAGIDVYDPLVVIVDGCPVSPEDVTFDLLHLPSDGKVGGSKRVWKYMPTIPVWQANAVIYIIDPKLEQNTDKVLEYLKGAGEFIGLLFFRPRKRGYKGRFVVENWKVG